MDATTTKVDFYFATYGGRRLGWSVFSSNAWAPVFHGTKAECEAEADRLNDIEQAKRAQV